MREESRAFAEDIDREFLRAGLTPPKWPGGGSHRLSLNLRGLELFGDHLEEVHGKFQTIDRERWTEWVFMGIGLYLDPTQEELAKFVPQETATFELEPT